MEKSEEVYVVFINSSVDCIIETRKEAEKWVEYLKSIAYKDKGYTYGISPRKMFTEKCIKNRMKDEINKFEKNEHESVWKQIYQSLNESKFLKEQYEIKMKEEYLEKERYQEHKRDKLKEDLDKTVRDLKEKLIHGVNININDTKEHK